MRVGAALTTPGRVSIARWGGSGKRDEEEYARNRRDDVPRKVNRLKSGGYGPGAVRARAGGSGRGTSGRDVTTGQEATVKVKICGVAVAMPQGQSWAPPSSSESQ